MNQSRLDSFCVEEYVLVILFSWFSTTRIINFDKSDILSSNYFRCICHCSDLYSRSPNETRLYLRVFLKCWRYRPRRFAMFTRREAKQNCFRKSSFRAYKFLNWLNYLESKHIFFLSLLLYKWVFIMSLMRCLDFIGWLKLTQLFFTLCQVCMRDCSTHSQTQWPIIFIQV